MKMPVAAIAAATLFAAAARVSVAQEPTLAVEESGQLRHFALALDEMACGDRTDTMCGKGEPYHPRQRDACPSPPARPPPVPAGG